MMRVLLFVILAITLTGYSFWIYQRVELPVAAGKGLAAVRAVVMLLLLALLFDPRLPAIGPDGEPVRWVLLDASLSMIAAGSTGERPWDEAAERARELEGQGWNVVRFGDGPLRTGDVEGAQPDALGSRLAPALQAAAEAGARQVRVLSDLRFEDAVAVRAALETLPVEVHFEGFDAEVPNVGVAHFTVPDLLQPEGTPTAEVGVHGRTGGDSIEVEIAEEGRVVATVRVPAPAPGLRGLASVALPTPASQGRVRYTATVVGNGASTPGSSASSADAFPDDDSAVTYANVGHEAGALVLVSLRPDWEPRSLLPVLEEVTGLPGAGYLRAGEDRYVRLGRAADRGPPADSASVRRAASEAALLVVHGLGSDAPAWIADLVGRPGRRLVLPLDAEGAGAAGVQVGDVRTGEWYASPDIPTSPIAGALAGIALQGLPPLTDVFIPVVRSGQVPLELQLRGTGAPESAFALMARPSGRMAVALASGTWRWSMRDDGREPYRRVWSGVAGWLLADEGVATAEARPTRSVVPRGTAVEWSVPGDSVATRIVVRSGDDPVVDTTVTGGVGVATGILPPGAYSYSVLDAEGDTTGTGRFDVAATTLEMMPAAEEPVVPARLAAMGGVDVSLGRPLRTIPWVYLLLLALLCGEWVVRRRSGLR